MSLQAMPNIRPLAWMREEPRMDAPAMTCADPLQAKDAAYAASSVPDCADGDLLGFRRPISPGLMRFEGLDGPRIRTSIPLMKSLTMSVRAYERAHPEGNP